MKEFLNWLGFGKRSDYVRDYFYGANLRASIYMSVVIITLEVWMILRLIYRQVSGIDLRTRDYYVSHYFNYSLLLTTAVAMLVVAVRFIKGKEDSRFVGASLKLVLALMCVYFGVQISIADYTRGEQILAFATMEIFAICLLTWTPAVSFTLLTVSYFIFFWRLDQLHAFNQPEGVTGITSATMINGFTMWLSTLLFSFSNYNRLMNQALKDESLLAANKKLSYVSNVDETTGANNMNFFRAEAEKLLGRVGDGVENIVFLFFDVENFKSYNEKYGFYEGDALLKSVSEDIAEAFGGSLTARFSDDHFVVLTTSPDYRERIEAAAKKLAERQREVQLCLKCGAYAPGEEEIDVSVACDRARFACNSIKKRFKQNFRTYDKALEDSFQLKKYVVNNIDAAVENGYIQAFYQPVVSTATGKLCGLEALARWRDPRYGLLPPGAFIDTLEEYRQIHKLDCCVIRRVCADVRSALDEGRSVVPVSLNFSRLDFELCDIVGFLSDAAKEFNVPKKYLDVEITETALAEDPELLQKAIADLRKSGFKVWLDDFGSGYSSLNVLKDFQFDVMKIDMKLLAGFPTNAKTKTILTNVVGLTKELRMDSLTEGVETEEQFDFLRSIGCNKAQGYLFSKPVPGDKILEMINDGKLVVEDN